MPKRYVKPVESVEEAIKAEEVEPILIVDSDDIQQQT